MAEQWRPVKGYEGKYIVSNKGNLMSVPRTKTETAPMTDEAVDMMLKRMEEIYK